MISGVVLAAGSATRMGSAKQLATIDGRSMLQHVVDRAAASSLDELIVVIGHEASAVEASIALPPNGRFVRNPDHSSGQAASFAVGLGALGPDVDAALILLGDQPDVRPGTIDHVCRRYEASGGPVVRARYDGVAGHPVLIDRELWDELASNDGDRGAGPTLDAHPEWTVWVDVDGPAPQEIDTPEDLNRVRERGLASI